MRYKLDICITLDCIQSRLIVGPSSCFMGQHIWPAKGLEEVTWPSKTDVITYHQERHLII